MSISDLRAKMKAMVIDTTSSDNTSDRYWNLTTDSAGNGTATIRFLPSKDLSKSPYVTVYSHWFDHPTTGKTYNEISSSTWKKNDPVGDFNSWLWKKGDEDKAKSQKRQTKIYVNILVVKDPAKPENEGKVFVYRMGTKILDKIKAQLAPQDEDDEPMNAFDLFEGKNFRLRAKMLAGYRNYDDSTFADKVSPIADTDEEIEEIFGKVYDLHELFLDESKDKAYDDKLKIMSTVFGRDPLFQEWLEATGKSIELPEPTKAKKVVESDDDLPWDEPETPKAKPKKEAPKIESTSDSEVDDILSELGL